jgi:protein-disulfide isomerase
MHRLAFRRFVMGLIAVPLSLALAACGSGSDSTSAAPNGDPIAKIAPPAGKAWADVVEKTPEGGYRMGNPEAPIKLVEFGSLTCPHCADFAAKSAAELRDNFVASGRVSFEFRNFVRDGIDLTAAQLTRCGAPESYFALTEQAFANQQAMIASVQKGGDAGFEQAMKLPDNQRGMAIAQLAGLIDFFASRGISKEQSSICLADAKSAEALAKATQDQAKEFDIQGTPTFLINGSKAEAGEWPELKAKLETMGAR